jgi:diketogulonate reductase-like aldo/keto reductase
MRVGRERIFITTKLTPYNLSDRYRALKAAEASIKRLNVKTIDLILAHWSESYFRIKDEVKSLEALLEAGYTRYIGVSNYSIEELEEAMASLRRHDIVVDQVRYNVYDKDIERGLLEYCIKNKITVQAYTPLEHGRVSEDPFLREIGEKYNKTPVQVALNYLISHYNVVPIPKTEKIERVDEIYGSLGWRLSRDDLEAIRKR